MLFKAYQIIIRKKALQTTTYFNKNFSSKIEGKIFHWYRDEFRTQEGELISVSEEEKSRVLEELRAVESLKPLFR